MTLEIGKNLLTVIEVVIVIAVIVLVVGWLLRFLRK